MHDAGMSVMHTVDNSHHCLHNEAFYVVQFIVLLTQFIADFVLHQTNIWVQMFTLMSRPDIFTSPFLLVLLIFLSQAFHKLVIVRRLIVECDIIGN